MLLACSSRCPDKLKMLREIKEALMPNRTKAIISSPLVKTGYIWPYRKKDIKIPLRTELFTLDSRKGDEFLIWLYNQTYRSWTGTKSGCNYQPIIKFKISEWTIWFKARLDIATMLKCLNMKVTTRNAVVAWVWLPNEGLLWTCCW